MKKSVITCCSRSCSCIGTTFGYDEVVKVFLNDTAAASLAQRSSMLIRLLLSTHIKYQVVKEILSQFGGRVLLKCQKP